MFGAVFQKKKPAVVVRSDADRAEPYTAAASLADGWNDADIERLNGLLPWAAFTLDAHGRRLGCAHSSSKRAVPQVIPDPRIEEFDRLYGIRGKRVLEIGCFEGIHTIALARLGGRVLAVDSRIENMAKTAVRCAVYGMPVELGVWDVEAPPPPQLPVECALLHHVGVLYHLLDPVAHLAQLLPKVRQALLLDTHIATPGSELARYVSGGRTIEYWPFREGGRQDPFSGMGDHAKWLPEATLRQLLGDAGFEADVFRLRQERNGLRAMICAHRVSGA